jgi:LysW-gamma-L-lysine carboxypeptidase
VHRANVTLDPVELLQALLHIESLSGEEAEAVYFLVAQMGALGMAARVDEVGNAVGVRQAPAADGRFSREILLLGHVDTVPGRVPVRVADGCLYGRGAVDAKGPLAAFVIAAARAPLPPGTRVVVVGAVEEESATSRGARHVAETYWPDWCIIGEPSGVEGVTLGYKGRLALAYELSQPVGHSAGPDVAVAETAVAFWQALQAYAAQYNEGRARLFDRLLPSLRSLCTDGDGLMERATARIGLRLPPGFGAAPFLALAQSWAGAASLAASGHEAAFEANRRSPLVQAFSRAIRQTGARPRLKLKTGTADMNVVGPRWNCPIVAYGPGDSRLDHTPQEHVVLAEYLQAIRILQTVLRQAADGSK